MRNDFQLKKERERESDIEDRKRAIRMVERWMRDAVGDHHVDQFEAGQDMKTLDVVFGVIPTWNQIGQVMAKYEVYRQ